MTSEWRVIKIPEGPELAYSRDRIKQLILGKALTDLSVGNGGRYIKSPPQGLSEFLKEMDKAGAPRVKEVGTHGKFMWWRFNFPCKHEDWYLHCTYGMSGGWYTFSTKHTAFSVGYNDSGIPDFPDTQRLSFNDPRHFGTLKFMRSDSAHNKKLSTLGPCILGGQLTPEIFAINALKKPNRTIAEMLMDQSCISGVGNYLRAEILYDCKLDPWKKVLDLTSLQYVILCESTIRVASASYRSQGASIKTYRTVDGETGTTQFDFLVYSRKTCPLGHVIQRAKDPKGRMMHWCGVCQR